MKSILALVATIVSFSTLVAGACVNKQFRVGWNAAPPGCEYGWSVHTGTGCTGSSSTVCFYGGFYIQDSASVPKSYYCDEAPGCLCRNRAYGIGTYQVPCTCEGKGVTIFQNTGCGGQSLHVAAGGTWTTNAGSWTAKSFRCD